MFKLYFYFESREESTELPSLEDALEEARLLYDFCNANPIRIEHNGFVVMDENKIINYINVKNEKDLGMGGE